ncbi:hypothetical protein Rsub_11925 [Raphidocelis subcapitata]|uniref:Protein kinase domain-containing protein n=1 Tax=Raphidocelis subcapitata TaxID=307507 RepID=A0A2V0PIP0_9CHLO|nr:hypothetical protein Rsub_11925 [Raphidocelis subcapitata]|eukprot:GBF99439.1 hypothetical protein Rsub_11925 [Raphidocelis subcapitata]
MPEWPEPAASSFSCAGGPLWLLPHVATRQQQQPAPGALAWRLPGTGGVNRLLTACPGVVQDVGAAALFPGALLSCGKRGAAYRLGTLLYFGPRSRVWRARRLPGGVEAVIKIVDASSAERRRAAELERRLLESIAASAAVPSSGPAAGAYTHWSRLREAWHGAVDLGAGGTDCVLLAMAPLHESMAYVLHRQGARGRRRGLPLDAVRGLAAQALTALDALHREQRAVHRDVKPSNLLLAQPFFVRSQGGTCRARVRSLSLPEMCSARWALADLGSAAALAPVLRWEWSPSRLWAVLPRLRQEASGELPYETPSYSPPEAVLHLPATPAWDMWALGCTLFEAATGTVLFGGIEDAATTLGSDAAGEGSSSSGGGGGLRRLWEQSRESSARAPSDLAVDAAHLALVRALVGPAPRRVLDRSPLAATFYDSRGELRLQLPSRRALAQRLVDSGSLDAAQAVDLAAFLEPLLRFDADERPSAREALAHPWLLRQER